ncbi:Protein lethal(2) giant larvae [Cryptotermes secundus]|uniref:Protein lethal(2) giant larvae n=1 Tax=Cryptotermes secundus TaxID=105785 RepID=A0A2J7Q3P2_9NEOP|nr:lethal(2) giant larvae protein homolog 1 isoform X3 [Cryptotermes secundus]PNF23205.1 Protein lethal(2) giant larvae [Cryptotermes secundus]
MLKFIRGKGQQPSAERQKLQRELFAFRKTVQHGFPHKPTALAWDPALRLLAIGTATGSVKVFGKPGVEFYGQHTNHDSSVTQLVFLPNEGRIVSLCDDNSLHLWEINEGCLEEVKSQALEGKLKKISAVCLESACEHLLLGTEGGNIYLLNLKTFEMADTIIYQDVVMQNVPEDYKINPGAVEAIAEQPGNPDRILIGYNRGLMVLWDRKTPGAEQTYISTQQLESVCWHKSGSRFASSHNDGSYAIWDASVGERPSEEPTTVYGPFPCKAVTKLLWRHAKKDDYMVFAGGMPRASYSDRHTITVQHGKRHVVFDFTSKVIDFFTVAIDPDDREFDEPEALIVLLEEELLAIDLLADDWRMLSLPYLVSLHASAVTCSQHISGVPQDLWQNIMLAGKKQTQDLYSDREWPVTGGKILGDATEGGEKASRELLLTGHEDGTVRFWDASGIALQPLYKFGSAQLFSGEEIAIEGSNGAPDEEEDEDEWPPFRKVGAFDPYSDDPRLAVKKVALCPMSGTLVVAGTAGSVIVAKINSDSVDKEVEVTPMNIVLDRDGFVWKGHDQLTPRGGTLSFAPGFQPNSLFQLHPPAAITALALHAEWGLVAAGTAHGLALFDYIRRKGVLTKCTLNPNDLSGAGDAPISRRKSFKKSLRESFRRLRKGRSTRQADKRGAHSTSPTAVTPTDPRKKDGLEEVAEDMAAEAGEEAAEGEVEAVEQRSSMGAGDAVSSSSAGPGGLSPLEAKPVERQVEARPVDDSLGSMVRCLYFAKTFLITVQMMTATMWAGTNNGTVFVFTVTIPSGARRTEEDVSCQLGKEIQLKHRAPVIGIAVIDGTNSPLPEPYVTEKGSSKQQDSPHRVVICSEEQFKIFTLPSLKPFCKFKLTAHEGARVRRMGIAQFTTAGGQHSESCLVCLTNLGDCIVLSVPELRRQLNAAVIRREDINGISSLTFTRRGQALYLHSSSELQRVTLSATSITQPRCRLELPDGARESASGERDTDEEDEDTEDDEEERKIEGREVSAPSPTAQEQQDSAPVVNGGTTDLEGSDDKTDEPRENGMTGGTSDEDRHDMSALSVGDITIDSVKDHLFSTSGAEESRVSELKSSASSTMVTTTTATTEKLEQQQQSVVVRTTTTVISSTTSGTVTNETATVNSTGHTPDIAVVESSPPADGPPATHILNEISSRKAPLAKMEDLEMEPSITAAVTADV